MITHRFRLSGLVGAVIAWLLLLLSEFICAHLDTCSRRCNCPKEAHEGFGEDKAYHEGAELENPELGYSLDLNCIRMISPGNAGGDPVVPETNDPE